MAEAGGELIRFRDCVVIGADGGAGGGSGELWVRDGRVVNPEHVFYVERARATREVRCGGALLAPGLVDLQINGGWGVDFSYDLEDVEAGVRRVAKSLLAHGVTSFCPTMVTSDSATYHKVLPHIKKTPGGRHGASVLGVHLEGPFINQSKKGAHAEEFIRSPEKGMESISEMYGNIDHVSIVTLAPELAGADKVIKGLTSRGVSVAVGHSAATLSEGEAAVGSGATLITHLFNAMLPFHHRDPGLVGLLASAAATHVHYGIISDGIHTHPAALRIALKTNPEGLVLVSDAVPALGLPDGRHHIGPRAVAVENGRAYITATGSLCGSTSPLDSCVRTLIRATGCSKEYALAAASLHPARALNLQDRKGTLNFGADADFVMLHPQTLQVLSTWIAGQCVYSNEFQLANCQID